MIDLNTNAFTHLHKIQVETFAISLFNKVYNYHEFKSVLRDFLVNLKSFSGNNDELYEEEKLIQINEARTIAENVKNTVKVISC